MKKKLFRIATISIICSVVVLINACKKDDTTSPILTLNGADTVYVILNKKYSEAGATATDDKDGGVSVTSDVGATNPNVNLVGTYILHYSAADNSGNVGQITRTVIVSNEAKNIAGSYAVHDVITGKNAGTYNYTVTVTPSATRNKQLYFANFSGLGATVTVTTAVSGSTISLTPVPQNPSGMPDPGTVSSGTGTIGSGGNNITDFTYDIHYPSTGTDDHGSSTWTKL